MSTLIQSSTEHQVQNLPEKKVWTDKEFMALPDRHRYELVDGELIEMGSAGAKHGYIAIILSSALFAVVMAKKLGALFDSSTAFKIKNGNQRSPDVSFFAKERLQGLTELPTGFLEGAPDLAVEVLSPGIALRGCIRTYSREKIAARNPYGRSLE